MDAIFVAAGILGGVGTAGILVQAYGEKRKRDKYAAAQREEKEMRFSSRRAVREAEVKAQNDAAQSYVERINAAFDNASEEEALVVSIVDFVDVEIDKIRARNSKTLLTRITPILTQQLAEKIRDFEIRQVVDFDAEGLADICLEARRIKWLVEEVPRRFEPKDLRDTDRISYPDLSTSYLSVPADLRVAARKMLSYDDAYVAEQFGLSTTIPDFDVEEN